jgi:2-keto-4-pentenoate hydratase
MRKALGSKKGLPGNTCANPINPVQNVDDVAAKKGRSHMTTTVRDISIIRAAADRIQTAFVTGQPALPVRTLIGAEDIDSAYAVQQELNARRVAAGGVVIGRKIGLTAPSVQQQLGVDQPDFGVLFADMDASGETLVPYRKLLQPKVEAEVAFVLAEDIDRDVSSEDQIRRSIRYAVAALEIVDSRIANWDLSIADTVADNASSGLFVLGENRLEIDEFEPRDVVMRMSADGVPVSAGSGAACLGDPILALMWLARTAAAYGQPLRAGQIVLSGALGPMAAVRPGVHVEAEIEPLGSVSAAFSEA